MIKKVNNETLKSEIRLKMFFEISYGKEAKGVKIYDAKGGYFQPENLESSEFISNHYLTRYDLNRDLDY